MRLLLACRRTVLHPFSAGITSSSGLAPSSPRRNRGEFQSGGALPGSLPQVPPPPATPRATETIMSNLNSRRVTVATLEKQVDDLTQTRDSAMKNAQTLDTRLRDVTLSREEQAKELATLSETFAVFRTEKVGDQSSHRRLPPYTCTRPLH